jgi:hypothetical protein
MENEIDEIKGRSSSQAPDDYKRLCVVTNWSQFRSGKGRFLFEYINVHLCNYIVFSSLGINDEEFADNGEYTLKSVQHNDMG